MLQQFRAVMIAPYRDQLRKLRPLAVTNTVTTAGTAPSPLQ